MFIFSIFDNTTGIGSPHVAQAGFELMTLLSQILRCWDMSYCVNLGEYIHILIHFKDGETVAFRTEATVSFPGAAGANDHNLRRVLISNHRNLLTQRCRDRKYLGQIPSALEDPL